MNSRGAGREDKGKLLQSLSMDMKPSMLVEELSPGQKQNLQIAKAPHQEARILIMDEPTALGEGGDRISYESGGTAEEKRTGHHLYLPLFRGDVPSGRYGYVLKGWCNGKKAYT